MSSPRRGSQLAEESVDRNGHWCREFAPRGEGWSVVEHWAAERGYGLIFFKARRRIYRKGDNPRLTITYVEFRRDEENDKLRISAWIETGVFTRVLTLFCLPAVFNIHPRGFWGIRSRRGACGDLNVLLSRMHQPLILGSMGMHWADLDLSTLFLASACLTSLVGFALASGKYIEIARGLSNGLLQVSAIYAAGLALCLVILASIQQLWISKKFDFPIKGLCALGLAMGFAILTLALFTKAKHEMRLVRFAYHCVQHFQESRCGAYLDAISVSDRARLMERLYEIEDAIAKRSAGTHFRNGSPIVPNIR
jgi:hypothetical protein